MIRRCLFLPVGAGLWLLPQAARAHGVLKGVGDFYAGLLHPIVVPAELLAIVAIGLLLGGAGVGACRIGISMCAGGVTAGLIFASVLALTSGATPLLLVAALLAAAVVTSGLRSPIWFSASVAWLAGMAIGIDASPEAKTLLTAVLSGMATVLGGTALTTVVAALAIGAERFWHKLVVRMVGSWIAAISIMCLVLISYSGA